MKKKNRKSKAPSHGGRGGADGPALSEHQEELPHTSTSTNEEPQTELNEQHRQNVTLAVETVIADQQHAAPESSAESGGVLSGGGRKRASSVDDEQVANDLLEVCSPREGTRILERFFTVLVMANLAVHVTLKPFCGQRISMEKLEDLLHQAGLEAELLPIERKAFKSVAVSSDQTHEDAVHVQSIYDQASAIAFRAEMCELQIRAAVLENGAGSKPSKAKLDVQRIVTKLVSHLPSGPAETITSAQFEAILEEKLGLTPGSFLAKIVFARIIKHPFQRSFPRVQEESKAAFCEALEQFCMHKPLSLDSVEGQLRHLVANHPDLRQTFQTMDLDSSGSISMREFVVFLQREAQMHFPDDVLKAFIKRFDIDGDGTLNYKEFIEFVRPKQFGINMSDVVEKIKTRMFWLQHNDLFAVASAASSASAVAAATRTRKPLAAAQPPAKFKVNDRFILAHHFGALRLEFQDSDPIMNVLTNGELVVLVLCKDEQTSTTAARPDRGGRVDAPQCSQLPPPFEYRLKPTTKRNIPPLFSATEMLKQQDLQQQQQVSSLEVTATRSANKRKTPAVSIRKLSASRRPSIANSTSNRSSSSSRSMQTRARAAPSIKHTIAAPHPSCKVIQRHEREDISEQDDDESSTSSSSFERIDAVTWSSRNAGSAQSAPAIPSLNPPSTHASALEMDGVIVPGTSRHMSQSIASGHEDGDDDAFEYFEPDAGDEGASLEAAASTPAPAITIIATVGPPVDLEEEEDNRVSHSVILQAGQEDHEFDPHNMASQPPPVRPNPQTAHDIPHTIYEEPSASPASKPDTHAAMGDGPAVFAKDITCAICLQQIVSKQPVKQLCCAHVFHAVCVDQWLRQEIHCPICKTQVLFPKMHPETFHAARAMPLHPQYQHPQQYQGHIPMAVPVPAPLDGTNPELYGVCRDCQTVFYRDPNKVRPDTGAWFRCPQCRGTDLYSYMRASCTLQ